MSNRTISFVPVAPPIRPPPPQIELGVIYEDPDAGSRRNLKWFIGTLENGVSSLICLFTGVSFPYKDGKLPGGLRPVGPGTLSITTEGETS